ncbi:MAG: hypothetical protein HYX20_03855 [Candidatus Yanofskybacteria bacterium]|nr:hypothetical protein [Candidatus Yanofskybacteria bacterium]
MIKLIFAPNANLPIFNLIDAAACERKGGVYERAGLAGYYRCIAAFPDAGKECTSSKECSSGRCQITESGQKIGRCKKDDNPFGCFGKIEDGYILCVD